LPAKGRSLQFAATAVICCNWLQVFHTKVTEETKRRAEVEATAIRCNWLQLVRLAASISHQGSEGNEEKG
jgi:hypothetical protein